MCHYRSKPCVNRLHQREDQREESKERREILDWLSPDPTLQRNDFLKRLYKGTGEWLFKSDEFKTWLGQNDVLFCPGMPGAGKTTLTAAVIEHLVNRFDGDDSVGVAFFSATTAWRMTTKMVRPKHSRHC